MTNSIPNFAPPPPHGWWARNWKWAAPLGCLVPILACGGTFAVLIGLLFSSVWYSEPYRHALKIAQDDPRVIAILGQPIHSEWNSSGRIKLNGTSSGGASFSIPIAGPKGSGTVVVSATKINGVWSYQTLRFVNHRDGHVINLLPGIIVRRTSRTAPQVLGSNSPRAHQAAFQMSSTVRKNC